MWLNQWPSQKPGWVLVAHNEILCTNSAMNKLFFMLMELFFLSHLILENQSVSQKVYLKFGRGIPKFSEKSLTVPKHFAILKFGHEHFIYFYFSDGPLTQSFIWIWLWKPQSVPKLLGHSFWWLWQDTNKCKYFHVWLGLPITTLYRLGTRLIALCLRWIMFEHTLFVAVCRLRRTNKVHT